MKDLTRRRQFMPKGTPRLLHVVRAGDFDEIDWSREPTSDQEQRVRSKYLERCDSLDLLALKMHLLGRSRNPASDLAAACDVSDRSAEERRRASERARIREAREDADADSDESS